MKPLREPAERRPARIGHSPWFLVVVGLLAGVALMGALALSGQGEPGAEGAKDAAEHGGVGVLYNAFNVALIGGSLTTGALVLFRTVRVVVAARFHRGFGWALIALFVLDVGMVSGATRGWSVVEWLNVVLLTGLAVTSLMLFIKPRRLWRRCCWPLRNIHVGFAMVYASSSLPSHSSAESSDERATRTMSVDPHQSIQAFGPYATSDLRRHVRVTPPATAGPRLSATSGCT